MKLLIQPEDGIAPLNTREMKDTVEKAVKEPVRERVQDMLSETVEQEQ